MWRSGLRRLAASLAGGAGRSSDSVYSGSALHQLGGLSTTGSTASIGPGSVTEQLLSSLHACSRQGHPSFAASVRFCQSATRPVKKRASAAELGMYGAAAAVAMIGFAYASVPLYRMVCAATGYGGAVQTGHTVEEKMRRRQEQPDEKMEKAAAEREITVWFNGDVAENMPWSFSPTQESVRVRPGQSALAFFTAKNDSDRPVTGYSVYNVTPEKAALYFNKIQCFCFEEQRLRAQEEVDMPVLFYIDPEMAVDWNCRNVSNITLSYTFHKVDSDEEEEEELQIPSGIKLHGPGTHPPLTAPGATAAAAAAAGSKQQQPAAAAA